MGGNGLWVLAASGDQACWVVLSGVNDGMREVFLAAAFYSLLVLAYSLLVLRFSYPGIVLSFNLEFPLPPFVVVAFDSYIGVVEEE